MTTFTYVKNPNVYSKDVHTLWIHLFQHMDSLKVTKMASDKVAVEFIPMDKEAEKVVEFLIDCDMGMVLTEEQRREYEEEMGILF